MKDEYKYKKCMIKRTYTTTDVLIQRGTHTVNEIRRLFEIDGDVVKSRGLRPFLTTIKECKDWINIELNERN